MRITVSRTGSHPLKSPHPGNQKVLRAAMPPMPLPPMAIAKLPTQTLRSVAVVKASSGVLGYPTLVLYPTVYPHLDPYPAIQRTQPDVGPLYSGAYPVLVLYPAVYPAIDIYPAVQQVVEPRRAQSSRLPVRYPDFNLCLFISLNCDALCAHTEADTPVYPSFRIYDVIGKEEQYRSVLSVRLAATYPTIAVCELNDCDCLFFC
jgi:hypothetical protein